MINFFRKIRQKLLSKNKFSKYLIYAIGEIVLVVIGILIALQINLWNEKRKLAELSDSALKELQIEVINTKAIVNKRNKDNIQIAAMMKTYLEGQLVNPNDSLKNRIVSLSFAYNPVRLSIPVIEREVNTDKLIIGQDSLLRELQEFENLYINANQQLSYLDYYWNNNVTNFLEEQKLMYSFVSLSNEIDINTNGIGILYDSDDFKNVISMEFLHLNEYTQRISQLHKQLEKVERLLSHIIK